MIENTDAKSSVFCGVLEFFAEWKEKIKKDISLQLVFCIS